MKKLLIFLLFLLLLAGIAAGILYSRKEAMLSSRLEKSLEELSGVDVELSDLTISSGGKGIRIGQMNFLSPPGYFNRVLASLTNVVLRSSEVPWRKSHFDKISATLERVYVEKNRKSEYNIAALRPVTSQYLDQKIVSGERDFFVERLELTLGQSFLIEARPPPEEPAVTEMDFEGRTEVLDGINHPSALFQFAVMKVVEGLGQGPLTLPRGKILERLQEHTGKTL